MNYKDAISAQMHAFAAHPLARFIGYGLLDGKGGNGTMKQVPNDRIVETTVAENMMVGIGHGMAMCGFRPLVYIERMDFILQALDALVNHLDKAADLSRGQFNPCVIIRITVGNKTKPLFTGPTHVQDFSTVMWMTMKMPVLRVTTPEEVQQHYATAFNRMERGHGSTVLVDYKDLF